MDPEQPSARRPQVAVGAVIFDAQGRVLLIQRGHAPNQGKWSLPGGRVEAGETLATALQREVRAETGLWATMGPLLEVFEYIDDRHHYVILDYWMTAPQGELQAGEDAEDARFFDVSSLTEEKTTPGLLAFLARVQARCGSALRDSPAES